MTTKSKKTVETLEKTLNKSNLVDSAEQLELLIERAKKAQKIFDFLWTVSVALCALGIHGGAVRKPGIR